MSLTYPATVPSNGAVTYARLDPVSVVDDATNRRYSLLVSQQPKRARMCGFGDKDRRPITPPPCVRLIITDVTTGKEVDVNEIDHSMYVINVDLWNEEGDREVNLIRHSSTAPSISATTPVPFMAMLEQPPPAPYPALMSSTREAEQPYRSSQGALAYPQSHVMPPQPRTHAHAHTHTHAHALPQSHMAQPHMAHSHPQMSPHPQLSHSHMSHYPPPPAIHSPVPSQYGATAYSPATQYFPSPRDYGSDPNGMNARFPGPPNPYDSMQRAQPGEAVPGPSGMFTRNLIGSLAASAFRLEDSDKRIGIWFVLQDLSVRTEGNFRLRFSFVNVGPSAGPSQPVITIPGVTPPVNQGKAPVLAAVFSDVFSVFSAKKFPGVCESTQLSKSFALQGIKIPIRKESSGRGEDDDEY